MRSANSGREQAEGSADSRTAAPRNSAMNWSSSQERPNTKRRALDFRGLSAHETIAATRTLRTAGLLSVLHHTSSEGSEAYYYRKRRRKQGGEGEVSQQNENVLFGQSRN